MGREVDMCLYLLLGLSQVVMKGYDFGQVGGNDGYQKILPVHKYSRDAGAYPPNIWSKDSLRPLVRRGAVGPNDVPEKNKECVLGMGCGHLANKS